MCPREKHVPEGARATSLSLTDEDRAAIVWVGSVRRRRKNNRTTLNDILVDALWELVQKEGKTEEDFRAMMPTEPAEEKPPSKIKEMPNRK
jgi:hypothetical protein